MMDTKDLILCHFLCLFVFSVALKIAQQGLLYSNLFPHGGDQGYSFGESKPEEGGLNVCLLVKSAAPTMACGGFCMSCLCLPALSGFTFVSLGMSLRKRSFCVCQCTHSSALMGITFRKSRLIPDQICQCSQQSLF